MGPFNSKMSDTSKAVKSRYITPFCAILAIVAFANTYIYAFKFQSDILALFCFISGCTALLLPPFKKYLNSHYVAANILVIIFFVCISALTTYTGGIYSYPIWWMATIPLTATFLMNSFFGVIWYAVVLVNFFVMFYLGHENLLPPNVLHGVGAEGRITVSFLFNASLIAFLCILADLIRDKAFKETEDLKLRAIQLNQQASLGKLASGVAHEINNPLTVIKGSQLRVARMLEDDAVIDKKILAEYMQKIHLNVERIQTVTGLMKTIADQGKEIAITEFSLKDMFKDIFKLRREALLKSSIEVDFNFPEVDVVYRGIYSDLWQAFFNVIDNAIQELSELSGPHRITVILEQDESFITIMIKDNGRGIAPEFRDRIFDPFYTTKFAGVGRGLGLSYSLNTFVKNGGNLELVSAEAGTVFKMSLRNS